jgi:hypothetical protein
MAYAAGDTITAALYNVLVSNSSSPYGYNHFAGEGSGEYGLGQTELATVAGNDNKTTITAAQWNALMTGIINIANHTNDSITARTQVTAGDSIAIKSALEADLATLAASVAGGCTSATALDTSSAKRTSSAAGAWKVHHTVEHSITFANANTMRYFFNGGGKIRVLGDRTGSGLAGDGGSESNIKQDDWTTLLAAVGNLDIGSQASTRSGSGETVSTNGLANGFHDLGTGYTVILKLSSDNSTHSGTGSNYTNNYIEVSAKLNASVGSSTVMTVKYDLRDGAGDQTFTSGNTSSIDSEVDRVGVTRVRLYILSPNDEQGLAADITESATAEVSNAKDS